MKVNESSNSTTTNKKDASFMTIPTTDSGLVSASLKSKSSSDGEELPRVEVAKLEAVTVTVTPTTANTLQPSSTHVIQNNAGSTSLSADGLTTVANNFALVDSPVRSRSLSRRTSDVAERRSGGALVALAFYIEAICGCPDQQNR